MINWPAIASSSQLSVIQNISVLRHPLKFGSSPQFLQSGQAACSLDSSTSTSSVVTLDAGSCVLQLSRDNTGSAALVIVTASYGSEYANTSIRIWYPASLNVSLEDSELNRLDNAGCDQDMAIYQYATVHAFASFESKSVFSEGYFGLVAPSLSVFADVTPYVSLVSSNPTVVLESSENGLNTIASVNSSLVRTSDTQTATISVFEVAVGVIVRWSEVKVVPSHTVRVNSLAVALVSRAVIDVSSSSSSSSSVVSTTLVHELTSEGSSAHVYVWAIASDSSKTLLIPSRSSNMPLAALMSSHVTLSLTSAALLNLVLNTNDQTVAVLPDAVTWCGDAVQATWDICSSSSSSNSNNNTASAVGKAYVNAVQAVSVSVSLSSRLLARKSSSAASVGLPLPSHSALTIIVTFSDGSSRDFSLDSRTQVFVNSSSSNLVTLAQDSSQSSAIIVSANEASTSNGEVTITVSFATNNTALRALTASQQLWVVDLHHVTVIAVLSASHHVTSPSQLELARLDCAESVHQRAELQLWASLTDGSAIQIPQSNIRFSSSNSLVARIFVPASSSLAYAVGLEVGTCNVNGAAVDNSGNEVSVSGIVVAVGDSVVLLQSLTLTFDKSTVVSSSASTSVSPVSVVDVSGATRIFSLAALFADGSFIADLNDQEWQWWVTPNLLVTLATSEPSVLSADIASCTVGLLNNHYTHVTLQATSRVCVSHTSPVIVSLPLDPNLLPNSEGDVDIGRPTGVPFSPVVETSGSALINVPIRIKASAGLSGFEMRLFVNTAVFEAVACEVGTDWLDQFACTINDPPSRIKILGAASVVRTQGVPYVHVGTVTLRAVQTGVLGDITGEVQRIVMPSPMSVPCSLSTPCPFGLAGTGKVLVVSTASQLTKNIDSGPLNLESTSVNFASLPPPTTTTTTTTTTTHITAMSESNEQKSVFSKQLKSTCAVDVYGDVNGDCVFDVADAVLALQLYTEASSMSLITTTWQQNQLDPLLDGFDSNGLPSLGDIQYLLYTLSRKYRFLAQFNVTSTPGSFEIVAKVFDETSQVVTSDSQTHVVLVIATRLNANASLVTVGTVENATFTEGMVVRCAVNESTGTFRAVLSGSLTLESNVGVVAVIETFDALGVGSMTRNAPFSSTSLLAPAFSTFTPITHANILSPESSPESSATPSAGINMGMVAGVVGGATAAAAAAVAVVARSRRKRSREDKTSEKDREARKPYPRLSNAPRLSLYVNPFFLVHRQRLEARLAVMDDASHNTPANSTFSNTTHELSKSESQPLPNLPHFHPRNSDDDQVIPLPFDQNRNAVPNRTTSDQHTRPTGPLASRTVNRLRLSKIKNGEPIAVWNVQDPNVLQDDSSNASSDQDGQFDNNSTKGHDDVISDDGDFEATTTPALQQDTAQNNIHDQQQPTSIGVRKPSRIRNFFASRQQSSHDSRTIQANEQHHNQHNQPMPPLATLPTIDSGRHSSISSVVSDEILVPDEIHVPVTDEMKMPPNRHSTNHVTEEIPFPTSQLSLSQFQFAADDDDDEPSTVKFESSRMFGTHNDVDDAISSDSDQENVPRHPVISSSKKVQSPEYRIPTPPMTPTPESRNENIQIQQQKTPTPASTPTPTPTASAASTSTTTTTSNVPNLRISNIHANTTNTNSSSTSQFASDRRQSTARRLDRVRQARGRPRTVSEDIANASTERSSMSGGHGVEHELYIPEHSSTATAAETAPAPFVASTASAASSISGFARPHALPTTPPALQATTSTSSITSSGTKGMLSESRDWINKRRESVARKRELLKSRSRTAMSAHPEIEAEPTQTHTHTDTHTHARTEVQLDHTDTHTHTRADTHTHTHTVSHSTHAHAHEILARIPQLAENDDDDDDPFHVMGLPEENLDDDDD